MRRLSSLGSKNLAHRKGRSILTGTGIILGIAIFFGVLVANATTQRGVDNLIESFTGRADVIAGPIGAFDAKMPMGSLDRIRKIPGVRDVVGNFGFGTALADRPSRGRSLMTGARTKDEEPTQIFVAGIIPSEAQKIRDYPFVSGRFARPGADEIALSSKVADDIHVGIGDRLKIRGRKLTRELLVVGKIDVKDLGGFGNGGGRTFTSVETARKLQGEPPGTFNGAAIILTKGGLNTDTWIDAYRDAVPGTRFQNADDLASGFKQFLSVFGTFLTFFAAITLFVGAFLIYLTLSMAVIERTRIYGTLRALGATAKQVRRVVLIEAVAMGIVSTVLGLFAGLGLALGLLKLIGKLFSLDLPGLQIRPGAIIATVLVGLIVTAISALIPARRAGRLSPVEAMKGDYAHETRLSRTWILGVVFVTLGVALFLGINSPAATSSVIFILLGAVLLVPLLLRPVSLLLGRFTNRMARGVGEVAVLHLAKERSRSAYTLALVMVVMAMLLATGGLYLSIRDGIGEIVDRQFGADVFVQSHVPDNGTFGAKLAKQPGVEKVTPLRIGFTSAFDQTKKQRGFFVRTIDPASYFGVSSYFWKDGNDDAAKAALEQGGAVLASNEVARELDVKVGDDVTLTTTKGKHPFRLAATYIGAAGPPEITMGIKDARTYLSAGRPFAYGVKLREGERPGAVVQSIKKDLATYQPETQTAAESKRDARSQVATYFQIVYAILLIAAIVGLLGLANTLAMSVLQRFREIGILRAIGVTRSQTWRMVLVESTTMGLTAFVLSLPLGLLLTYLVVRGTSQGFGFAVPTIYPWIWVPFVALFGIVIAVVAAIAPGRRAARLQVVTALQYE